MITLPNFFGRTSPIVPSSTTSTSTTPFQFIITVSPSVAISTPSITTSSVDVQTQADTTFGSTVFDESSSTTFSNDEVTTMFTPIPSELESTTLAALTTMSGEKEEHETTTAASGI